MSFEGQFGREYPRRSPENNVCLKSVEFLRVLLSLVEETTKVPTSLTLLFIISQEFAEMYAAKMKTEPSKMLKNLWGDRFYFPKEKKWKGEKGPGGKVRLRTVVQNSHEVRRKYRFVCSHRSICLLRPICFARLLSG